MASIDVVSKLSTSLLTFGIVDDAAEHNEIFNLREEVYQAKDWQHLLMESNNRHCASDEFDNLSFLFYLKYSDEMIASCRVLPLVHNMLFKNTLTGFTNDVDLAISTIIERLVVKQDFRGKQLYKFFLSTVCRWFKENTHYQFWFAKCHPTLTPLYLYFKAVIIGSESIIDSHGNLRDYHYLKGNVDHTLIGNQKFILPLEDHHV